jgi:hypothetical protein
MSDSFFNWLKHMVRGLLVAFPLVALFGFLFPWPAGERALGRYPGQTPIMVAYFSHTRSSWDARSHVWVVKEKSETRSYVLFPSVFINPRIVTVAQANDDAPTLSESRGPLLAAALAGMIAFVLLALRYFATRAPTLDQMSLEEAAPCQSQLPQRGFGRRTS